MSGTSAEFQSNRGRHTGSAVSLETLPPYLCGFLLMVLAAVVFANGLSAPFYLDDNEFLERRPTIRTLTAAWDSLSTRRIGTLSFAVNYRLHGLDPRGFRVANIAFHGLAACALFGFTRRTLLSLGDSSRFSRHSTSLAFAIAAIWLVHPIQTGAVTYVVQRFESLMGLFFLFSLYSLARARDSRWSWLWLSGSLGSLALAAQTKEVAVVFPAIAIAYDRIFMARSWRELLRLRGLYHLLLLATTWWILFHVRARLIPDQAASGGFEAASAGFGVASVTPWEYLRSQAGILVHYLWLSIWPSTLCLDYRWPIAKSPINIYPQGLFIVGLLAATARALWRSPRWGFLGVCFFAILAPTSSIVPIADLAFEHRMYLPLAVVITLVVLGANTISRRCRISGRETAGVSQFAPPSLVGITLASLIVAALATRTVIRNRDYVDPVRMWNSVLEVSPWNYRAHNQLALQYERRGRLMEAEHHFRETLRYRPDAWWVDIGLGNLRARQNRLSEAEQHFRRAAQQKAGIALAAANLGRLREREKNWNEAITFYDMALARNPGHLEVWLAKANALAELGQKEKAVDAYRQVLERDPRSSEAKRGLARCKTLPDNIPDTPADKNESF
ncbi:MAG: tetratricopeptide repeat protein [Planctomycetota bacterium]